MEVENHLLNQLPCLGGRLSVATDPVQQGNLTENPSLIITAVYGCYHEGKLFCSYTHFLIK